MGAKSKTQILSLAALGFSLILFFQNCSGGLSSNGIRFSSQNSGNGGNGDGYLGKDTLVSIYSGSYDPAAASRVQSLEHFYRWVEGATCISSSVPQSSHSGHLYLSRNGLQYELDSCTPGQPATSPLVLTPFHREVGVYSDLIFEKSTSASAPPLGTGYVVGYCRSPSTGVVGYDIVVRSSAPNAYSAELFQGVLEGSAYSQYRISAVPVQISSGVSIQFEGIAQALEISFERGLQSRVSGRLRAIINGTPVSQSMDCWSEFDTITIQQTNTLGGGGHVTVASMPTGKTFAWGLNTSGQTGTGSAQSFLDTPLEIRFGSTPQSKRLKEVTSYSGAHVCALTQDDDLSCWGLNGGAQIGTGIQGGIQNTPYLVRPGTTAPKALEVTAGNQVSSFTLADGSIYKWGTTSGIGVDLLPTPIQGLTLSLKGLVQGENFSCGIIQNSDQEVACWGDNSTGQLGTNAIGPTRLSLPASDKKVLAPGGLETLKNVVQLSASDFSVCALLASGRVVCWGDNRNGNLGDPIGQFLPFYMDTTDQRVRNISSVHLGRNRGCALSNQRNVYCWGKNHYAELGRGQVSANNEPAGESPLLSAMGFSDLHLGDTHSCGQFGNGRVFCWGNNSSGVTGLGISSGITLTPQEVPGL